MYNRLGLSFFFAFIMKELPTDSFGYAVVRQPIADTKNKSKNEKEIITMMKKILASALLIVMILSLAACGSSGGTQTQGGSDQSAAQGTAQTETQSGDAASQSGSSASSDEYPSLGGSYTMATGGTSGTFYPYGGALCQVINSKIGTSITANSTGGGKENVAQLKNEETDFALLDADMMQYALTGTESYEGNQIKTFGSIASLFPQVLHIVVGADSDINSVSDLRGKRVSVGDAGSGTAVNALQVLEAYDMTFDDIKVNYLSFKEGAAAFQDGTVDAFIGVAGMPTTAVTEVSLTRSVRILEIDQEHMAKLLDAYPFFAETSIPEATYGCPEVKTIAVNATVAALLDVDEEVVYWFTRAMFENIDEIALGHARGADLSLDTALGGIDTQYLHPGAARYYKEVGLL